MQHGAVSESTARSPRRPRAPSGDQLAAITAFLVARHRFPAASGQGGSSPAGPRFRSARSGRPGRVAVDQTFGTVQHPLPASDPAINDPDIAGAQVGGLSLKQVGVRMRVNAATRNRSLGGQDLERRTAIDPWIRGSRRRRSCEAEPAKRAAATVRRSTPSRGDRAPACPGSRRRVFNPDSRLNRRLGDVAH